MPDEKDDVDLALNNIESSNETMEIYTEGMGHCRKSTSDSYCPLKHRKSPQKRFSLNRRNNVNHYRCQRLNQIIIRTLLLFFLICIIEYQRF